MFLRMTVRVLGRTRRGNCPVGLFEDPWRWERELNEGEGMTITKLRINLDRLLAPMMEREAWS